MEPRSAMAYWQNGKLYLHGSTQSVARTRATVAQWVGLKPAEEDQVILISEYTGGGFGGKIPGAHSMAIPASALEESERPAGPDAHFARRGKLHRPRAARHSSARPHRVPQGRPDYRDGSVRDLRLRAVCESGRWRHAGVDRHGALQPGDHSLPRHQRADEHAASSRATRARRRAGIGDARAAHQQGGTPAQCRSGRDSEDQRAGHRIGIRAASAACAAGLPALPQRQQRALRRAPAGASQPQELGVRRGVGRRAGQLPTQQPVRPQLRPLRAARSLRAVICAKHSIWARSSSTGKSARSATGSATARR